MAVPERLKEAQQFLKEASYATKPVKIGDYSADELARWLRQAEVFHVLESKLEKIEKEMNGLDASTRTSGLQGIFDALEFMIDYAKAVKSSTGY